MSNNGVSDADNLHLTDTVDSRLIVDGVSGGAFDCAAISGQSVDCSLGHLAAGGSTTLTVTYHVDTATDSAASVANTADLTSD